MSEMKSPEDDRENVGELLAEQVDSDSENTESQRHRWRDAFHRSFLSTPQQRTSVPKRDPRQDRTRSLILLVGGIFGSLLLFLAVFSTPPTRLSQGERGRAQPNLGRPSPADAATLASVTPLLNAEPHSDDLGRDRLSATDIESTSQRDAAGYDSDQEVAIQNALEERRNTSAAIDPLIAYRRNDTTGAMTYSYGTPAVNAGLARTPADSLSSGTFSYGASNQPALTAVAGAVPKSSIVFVRSVGATASQSNVPAVISSDGSDRPTLLAPGSRLIARLESAVTSALKAPVVAAIEYNYERDGMILIPAGTKAIGELQQASINGYVGIAFHTLQMPDGRNEKIEAMAMDLRNEPLKGKVTGTNKGRKFLTRTLSGVGTIAAYVVGAGGSGLGQTITGETLLRDRLAGNIASAGEQELTNAAYSQNIVVTVPAQTRLYIVFRKGAVEPAAGSAVPNSVRSTGAEVPTIQELRELMDLRREINRMYEASGTPPNSTKQ